MSASAPAVAKQSHPALAMRLADPAATLAYVSFVFGLLLVVFPVSFPRIIVFEPRHRNAFMGTMPMPLFGASFQCNAAGRTA